MFKLIKWTAIIFVVVALYYGASFIWDMNSEERQEVKTGAVDAFEATVLSNPLADRIKADLADKKANAVEAIRNYLKKSVDKVIDSEVRNVE